MSRNARILVVDDSDDAAAISVAVLEEGQFGLIERVCSAAQAYERLGLDDDVSPPSYDCILMDIRMPEVDGVEACAAIRTSRRYRDVPIVMVSGLGEIETLNQAFVAGANDYVAKPVQPVELLARVRAALRFKREIDRRRSRERQLTQRAAQVAPDIGGFDPVTGLADRALLEARLRVLADLDAPASLILMQLTDFAAFRDANGDGAAIALLRRVIDALAGLDMAMGSILGLYDDGLLLLIGPDRERERLRRRVASTFQTVGRLRLSHGASAYADHVTLRVAADCAAGDALLELPGLLIGRLGRDEALLPFDMETAS